MNDDRVIPPHIAAEMAALEGRPIDLSDMPEATDWSKARRGLWHRIYRDDLIVMLEPKLMAWFRDQSREEEDINETVNRVLREQVIEKNRRAA